MGFHLHNESPTRAVYSTAVWDKIWLQQQTSWRSKDLQEPTTMGSGSTNLNIWYHKCVNINN